MGHALQFVARRFLRSRAGIAILLALLVLAVVSTARLLSDPADPRLAPPARPLVVTTPAIPDDGLLSPDAVPSPTVLPDAVAPETVATAFAMRWVDHHGISVQTWHARLLPYSTDALAQKLSGVDPVVVPADRITGAAVVIPQAATLVDVVLPVDSGRLRLRMLVINNRWLVDGVDWERA